MLINAFLLKIHDSHPIGKKLPSCWCTLYRVVKKNRPVEPQATSGTSGNKWNLSQQTNCIVRIDDKRH